MIRIPAIFSVLLLLVAGISPSSAKAQEGETQRQPIPAGTVSIDQVQVAFLLSGNFGGGTLQFKGETYPFEIGGLGVGGIGVSSVDADGTVYDLEKIEDFPGVYGQARAGIAVGTASAGELWLENGKGVVLNLKAKREGLILSLGVDGIVINMK